MIWCLILPAAVGAGWLLGEGDAAANFRAALEAAPASGLLATLGWTLGLYGRDRTRLRRSYASPTLAWLGKRLLLASLSAASTFAFAPVAWPAECWPLIAGAAAAGAAVWVGNLPIRL